MEYVLRRRSFVQAHGTGTPQNRTTESQILSGVAKAFGIEDWPVAAIKCFVGHTMAAAGGDQLASTLGVFARGILPGITTIDGIKGNVFTRMNYAPAEFQNVRFEKICEAPFVKIVALRDIAAGEELWVDYGPRYRYDFMEDPAVIKFFADLHAQRAKPIK